MSNLPPVPTPGVPQVPTGNPQTLPGSSITPGSTPTTVGGTFVMTDGWYVAIACVLGVMTADTKAGALVAGVLTVALIYQLTLLLEGK